MKKLLVTLIGAAALGAFADTGVWFEDSAFTVGSTQTVAQINTIVGDYMSELPDSTNVYKVAAMGSQAGLSGYPVADNFVSDPTKALDVNTTFGKPLSVTNKVAATIGDGVYFDSLVKFTVCEDPMTTEYDGAKIVMWLQEESENDVISGTNLYVKAGFLTTAAGVTGVSNAVYKCEYYIGGDFADKWHRVTIKAIDDITKDGSGIPGFVIFIDGTGATPNTVKAAKTLASVAKWDSTRTPALNESASFFNADGALFPSMVQSGPAKRSISTASFDGTGAVNMLLFTTTAPAFADDYREAKGGYKIGDEGTTTQFYDLADLASAINGYSQVLGDPVTFNVTFTKGFEVDTPVEFVYNEDVESIVIDFNGCVITNTVEACIITNNAVMTVVDTIGGGGIRSTVEDQGAIIGGAIAQGGYGSLTISGGNFWSNIDIGPAGAVWVTDGAFQQDASAFAVEDSVTYEITYLIEDGRWLFEETPGWYVVDDAFTVTFDPDNGGDAIVIPNVRSGTKVTAPEEPTKGSGYTFAGWSPDPEATTIDQDTAFTAQWTENTYTVKFVYGLHKENTNTVSGVTYGTVPTLPAAVAEACEVAGYTVTWPEFVAVAADATYEASYTVKTYTVTFVDAAGSYVTNGIPHGTMIGTIAPEVTPKSGYTAAWEGVLGGSVTSDMTVNAVYTGRSFTINVYTNGVDCGVSTNFTYETGMTVVVPAPAYDSDKQTWKDSAFYASAELQAEFAFNADGDATQIAYTVIEAKSSPVTPVAPGEDITPPEGKTAAEYANDINVAIAGGTGESYIEVPAEASGMKATYLGILKAQVNEKGKIDIVFNEEAAGYAAVTNAIETVAIPAVGDVLPTVAAAAAESSTDVSITGGLTPGLYYSISYCTDLANFGTQYENEGTRVKANASGAATLQTPAKASAATAGFYRVNVNVSDKNL